MILRGALHVLIITIPAAVLIHLLHVLCHLRQQRLKGRIGYAAAVPASHPVLRIGAIRISTEVVNHLIVHALSLREILLSLAVDLVSLIPLLIHRALLIGPNRVSARRSGSGGPPTWQKGLANRAPANRLKRGLWLRLDSRSCWLGWSRRLSWLLVLSHGDDKIG